MDKIYEAAIVSVAIVLTVAALASCSYAETENNNSVRLACIQAGMEWRSGDCRKEAK